MIDFIVKSLGMSFGLVTGVFTFAPESFFKTYSWISQDTLDQCKFISAVTAQDINISISRIVCFLLIWGVTSLIYAIFLKIQWWTTIKGPNYSIRVEYGNIFKSKKCKRVISFDECYTTRVGDAIADINPGSVCEQYLITHPNLNMQQLIDNADISPARIKSKYQHKTRYPSGTIVPNGDDLLLAFAKLDERGKGRFFSRDEYLECLDLLWKELENYYGEKDVCVPILGSGTTSFDGGSGASISQQDLLNMMIWSYQLSSHKIKAPHKLRIVCRRNGDFSLTNIGR